MRWLVGWLEFNLITHSSFLNVVQYCNSVLLSAVLAEGQTAGHAG